MVDHVPDLVGFISRGMPHLMNLLSSFASPSAMKVPFPSTSLTFLHLSELDDLSDTSLSNPLLSPTSSFLCSFYHDSLSSTLQSLFRALVVSLHELAPV